MSVKTFRPLTPSTRYITISDYSDITKKKPEKALVVIRKKTGGRNAKPHPGKRLDDAPFANACALLNQIIELA